MGERGSAIHLDDSVPVDPERPVVDSDLVKKTASLARLQLSEPEIPALVQHMERILDLVDTLRSVEIPADLVVDENVRSVKVDSLREDEAMDHSSPGGPRDQDSIGRNAPDWREGTFVTPRVVG